MTISDRAVSFRSGSLTRRGPVKTVDEAVAVAPRFQSSSATGGAVFPPRSRTTGISSPCFRARTREGHAHCQAPARCECPCHAPTTATARAAKQLAEATRGETADMLSPAACQLRDRIVKAIGLAGYWQRIVEVETLISKRDEQGADMQIDEMLGGSKHG